MTLEPTTIEGTLITVDRQRLSQLWPADTNPDTFLGLPVWQVHIHVTLHSPADVDRLIQQLTVLKEGLS